jgi:DNA-binding response OmpR family regulator
MAIPHLPAAGETPVLICSPSEKILAALTAILAGSGWTVHQTTHYSDTIALLEQHAIPVVIADGRWREILEFACALRGGPSVIVTVPFADEAIWAEVLNLGGYDVLSQPFDANEVTRIAGAALRRSMVADYHPSVEMSLDAAGKSACATLRVCGF